MKRIFLALLAVSAASGCKDRELREEFEAKERRLQQAADRAISAAEAAKTDFKSVGRFQVVNGMPSMARTVMLLDTITGRSWVYCEGKPGDTHWCSLDGGPASSLDDVDLLISEARRLNSKAGQQR